MPNTGLPSPASTPMLMLENNYRQLQEWGGRQEQELQSLDLDDEMFADRMQKLQTDYDKQRADIETNMNTVRQTQNWIDLGIIDETAGSKLKWRVVVPEEALDMMFPEPETVPEADTSRRPLTPDQLGDLRIKAFVKKAKVAMPGRNRPTYESLLKQYKAWQTAIGYHGKQFTNTEREQVDREWDTWVKNTHPETAWYPQARKEIRALRAKGPITRGFTARFRQTPTGPREAGDPLKDNIIANLPKQRQPTPEAQPEPVKLSDRDNEAIAWARQNPDDPRAIKILTLHGAQ